MSRYRIASSTPDELRIRCCDTTLRIHSLEPAADGAHGARDAALLATLDAELRLLDRFDPASSVGRINASRTLGPIAIPAELGDLLARVWPWRQASNGRYDPGSGSLFATWRRAALMGESPSAEVRVAARAAASPDAWSWDAATRQLSRQHPDAMLDFGSVGKGWIMDRLRACWPGEALVIDFGGSLLLPPRRDGAPWQIRVQAPSAARGTACARLAVDCGAIASSSACEQGPWHLIDPHYASPQRETWQQVTVWSDDAWLADLLSTLIYICGVDNGQRIIEELRSCGSLPQTTRIHIYAVGRDGVYSDWPAAVTGDARGAMQSCPNVAPMGAAELERREHDALRD